MYFILIVSQHAGVPRSTSSIVGTSARINLEATTAVVGNAGVSATTSYDNCENCMTVGSYFFIYLFNRFTMTEIVSNRL
jgi:hypothetical protein